MALHLFDKLAVEDDGDGDAVVCVHGLGGSSNTWTPLLGGLSRYRVLRVELPGSARSPATSGALSVERMADAVVGVCARLGLSRAHFVGHSMGTIVCQHVAAAQPKLVRSLALFGPLLAPTDAARGSIRARAAKAREGLAAMQEIAQALTLGATSPHSRQQSPLVAAFVRESLMRQDAEGYARSCEALADAKAAPVEHITAPTLLVTGDEDSVAPPQAVRAMAERLQGVKGGVRVVVLNRCGHWTPIERPDDCTRELRDFLTAQR
jgi:3-oxoadipate enol-lactonase